MSVQIDGLTKSFSATSVALSDVSLTIASGEMLVLLGPSGCGKTTILRCLAGLERPTAGAIAIGGATVFNDSTRTDVVPDRRNIGMVFQSYGLWPHLTVLENIRFPLRARHNRLGLKEKWAEELAELVSCSHLLDRHPGELSGGQQQRIALARALVGRPSLILFDEPLSNLDARLRADLRNAIRELHRTFKFTGVYVTHDQAEGLTVGDRIAVMNEGKIVQTGAPANVHRDPSTAWAADFMGMVNEVDLTSADVAVKAPQFTSSGAVVLRFRPVDARLYADRSGIGNPESVLLQGVSVLDRAYSGSSTEFVLQIGAKKATVQLDSRDAVGLPEGGGRVDVSLPVHDVRGFDAAGNQVKVLQTV